MFLFWLLASFMILAALLLIVPPLIRRRAADRHAPDAANVALYRERLADLDGERDRGEVESSRYAALREDLERGLLADVGRLETLHPADHRPPYWMAIAVAVTVPVCGLGIYLWLGSPHGLGPHSPSMGSSAGIEQTQSVETMVESLESRLADDPADAEGWLLLGRSQVVLERFDAALVSFGHAHALLGDDPALLSDWAEAEAAVAGNRFTKSARARLERALALNPDHEKALWLGGFAALQDGDAAAAIVRWERLLARQVPDSREASIVTEVLARIRGASEAESGAGPATSTPSASTAPEAASTVEGGARLVVEVSLAPNLKEQPGADEHVFVFARDASGAGPPVAVTRTTVAALPVTIVLDESRAMVPSRSLASVEHVLVTARIARSGSADRTSGDIEGISGPVAVADTVPTRIVMSQVVP